MGTHHYQFYCQRIDANRNMARYYALAIRPTLFGEIAVVRSWGRIGKAGGEMTEVFGNEKDAIWRFLELVLQKRKRGYKPAINCGNTKRITVPQTSPHDNIWIG
ncbi:MULTISPECIES: WGR domain-containing protein [Rhizobium/Agrobacterium group]|uniref:WGR domain-containing protein n=1 Tax=Rhizobium/Agrobacterium group TaxID=227290 RepID=UPI001ADC3B5B|nr:MULTISPECIES: WGR domain-containing protein [Rhizobium/Agrobacterium group]MBO9112558.1 WGR domain-containing protein [Agrobacterium sp. S2/73]QXZ76065.1 WGR domain-containing protein [Agrobacterium sp. S7/73]QYA16926.1 WGR domain-containing protein [Rhizobium sp. AB2/73]UEQ85501.1 WGR domain-containing protein [Rhizobium sp. AB2/73]